MLAFTLAVVFTLGVSGFCSVMEALILSTTPTEIEALKKRYPRRGRMLENLKEGINETISTILTLNTVANTLGSILIGWISAREFGEAWVGVVAGAMTFGILIFSEIIPKNVGVAYRVPLQPYAVFPLTYMRVVMRPATWLTENLVTRVFIRPVPENNPPEEEIMLLAEKSEKGGHLTKSELNMIANALSLDDVRVSEIMTPRTVVTAIDRKNTVKEVLTEFTNIPFARMPVYDESIDNIVGMVRRRDMLHAIANGQDERMVDEMKQEIHFIPETVTAAAALQTFLRTHQQLAVVVDEFGSVAGVVTMEDIMEHIIGREIFEKDDLAVDMRELARKRNQIAKQSRRQQASREAPPPATSASGPATTGRENQDPEQ